MLALLGSFPMATTWALHQAHEHDHHHTDDACVCGPLPPRPEILDHVGVARWMVHALHMGVVSTLSTKEGLVGAPFGNIYSFVDGPCAQSTGVPYFYASPLDQSAIDAAANPRVSMTLSEAFLPTTCHRFAEPADCAATTQGDPEMPTCARLVMSGKWVVVDPNMDTFSWAQESLFERHPIMADWPTDHGWQIARIEIDDLWFLDFFGGAYQLNVDDYLQYQWPHVDQAN